ncbi:MAG: hypothetical protein ACFB51_10115, partial [Anaerolineae bacterium]
MAKRFSLGFSLFLALSDLVLVNVALAVAKAMRINLPFGAYVPDPNHLLLIPPIYVITTVLWGTAFLLIGVYDPRNSIRLIREVESIVRASALGFHKHSGVLYLTYRQTSRQQINYFTTNAKLL